MRGLRGSRCVSCAEREGVAPVARRNAAGAAGVGAARGRGAEARGAAGFAAVWGPAIPHAEYVIG